MNSFFNTPANVEKLREALNQALLDSGYVIEDIDPGVTLQQNGIDSLDVIDLLMQIEDLMWEKYETIFPRNLDSLADFDGALGDYPQWLFEKLRSNHD